MSMEKSPLDLPQPGPRRALWFAIALIVVTIAWSLAYGWWRWQRWQEDWNRLGPLEPAGGLYFQPGIKLEVPLFRQGDERWRKDRLGNTDASVGAEGCAVAVAAKVLAGYGVDTDPGRLNRLVTDAGGYVGNGWLVWEKAAEVTGDIARKAYEGDPSYRLIDENLRRRNPVIVRLRTEGGTTHFVVIAGKEGYDYLTRDPGAGAAKGLYPLREFGSKIEALRFYEKVK